MRPRGAHSGGAHMGGGGGGHALAATQPFLHPAQHPLLNPGLPPGARLSAEQMAMLEAQVSALAQAGQRRRSRFFTATHDSSICWAPSPMLEAQVV